MQYCEQIFPTKKDDISFSRDQQDEQVYVLHKPNDELDILVSEKRSFIELLEKSQFFCR